MEKLTKNGNNNNADFEEKRLIEIRAKIAPEDEYYQFISNIVEHIGNDSPTAILKFILGKASKIPFSEFIKINGNVAAKV